MQSRNAIPPCPICDATREEYFRAVVLNKYDVSYFLCRECGLVQTEKPYWLEEAYSKAISDTDTGLVSRNLAIANRLSNVLYFCFDPAGTYLDCAGGYGLLTRLMRDRGFNFYWQDLYCKNVLAPGFEWNQTTAGLPLTAVTAFEVLEHVSDPLAFLTTALSYGGASTIILSTQLYRGVPPQPNGWWYYSLESGQHISFFCRNTLEALAGRLGLSLHSTGWFHVMTSKNINRVAFKAFSSRVAQAFGLSTYVGLRLHPRTLDDRSMMIARAYGAPRT